VIDIIRGKRAVELFEKYLREGMSRENAAKWAWNDTRPNRGVIPLDEYLQRDCDVENNKPKAPVQPWFCASQDPEKPVA
jgi:hypothetical protein